MLSRTSLVLHRIDRSETTITWVRVEAVNGDFSGVVEICPSAEELRSVGLALKAFPSKVPEKYEAYLEGDAQNLQVNASTTNYAGHCSLRISLIDRGGQWYFDTEVEAAAINRLGEVFVRIGDDNSYRGMWSPFPDAELEHRTQGAV
jgi:hypothetical protein